MKVLGITGGVGAGKSTVLDYLVKMHGARVIQADMVAHLLMRPEQECYYCIVEAFGSGILKGDQSIDRTKLGSLVFKDRLKMRKLNQIVHPAVKAYIAAEIEKEKERAVVPFVVIEAALLIEDNYKVLCDELWYIYVDDETRKKRLKSSRGYSDERIRDILNNQLQDEVFRKNCQFVVDNSSNIVENTYEQIDRGLVENGFL